MPHLVTLAPGDCGELLSGVTALLDALDVGLTWERTDNVTAHIAASARRTGVVLLGFEYGARDEGQVPPVVALRRELGAYANIRPIRNLAGIPSRYEGVDMLIVRETSEDVYASLEHESIPGVFESLKVTTRGACERIARTAFELARARGRKKVTIVHKSNIMKASDGMFLATAQAVAAEYPELAVEEVIVDALCMKLVLDPTRFDVLLCGNLYGDILSDLCTGLVGGQSNAPSINLSADVAVFTAGRASKPGARVQVLDDPLTLLLPAVHLLRHLGEHSAADRLRAAIEQTLLANGASRDGFCEAVRARLS